MALVYKKCKKKIKIIGPVICLPLKIKAVCKLTKKLKKISKIDCVKLAKDNSLDVRFMSSKKSLESLQTNLAASRNLKSHLKSAKKLNKKTRKQNSSKDSSFDAFVKSVQSLDFVFTTIEHLLKNSLEIWLLLSFFKSFANSRTYLNEFKSNVRFKNVFIDQKFYKKNDIFKVIKIYI